MNPAFSIGDVAIRLEGAETKHVYTHLSRFFVFGAVEKQAAGDGVSLHVYAAPLPKKPGHTVYQAKALTVTRTETGFSLRCGASQLQVTPGSADAPCFLAPDFSRHSPFEQREFFLLGLLMLLRPLGRYGLHACGLERYGAGLLLVGSSGSGKTTTSLSLIGQGWQYLSDDAVLLTEQDDTVQAEAFRQGFSCTPKTLAHFPDLGGNSEFGDPGGKRVVYPEGSFTPTCTPSLIVFPQVTERETQLRPLTTSQSLIRLCQQSAGIMTDTAVSQRQLRVLRILVRQARSFELHLGQDALEDPTLTDTLLSQTLEETPLCVS